MTREVAYTWNENSHDLNFTTKVEDMKESIHFLLKKIYDDFEKELYDNNIRAQEVVNNNCKRFMDYIKNRTCESCEKIENCTIAHFLGNTRRLDFGCTNYKAKQ